MTGLILPTVPMTDDERRGFRIACGCFATWGQQLASEPTLAGSPAADAVRRSLRTQGRTVAAMARALDRSLGQSGPPT